MQQISYQQRLLTNLSHFVNEDALFYAILDENLEIQLSNKKYNSVFGLNALSTEINVFTEQDNLRYCNKIFNQCKS